MHQMAQIIQSYHIPPEILKIIKHFLDWQLQCLIYLNILLLPMTGVTMYAAAITVYETFAGYTKATVVKINRLSFAGNIGFFLVYVCYATLYYFCFFFMDGVDMEYLRENLLKLIYISTGFLLSIIISQVVQPYFLSILDEEDYDYFIGRNGQAARAPSIVLFNNLPTQLDDSSLPSSEHNSGQYVTGIQSVHSNMSDIRAQMYRAVGMGDTTVSFEQAMSKVRKRRGSVRGSLKQTQ